ncbi:MAG: dihydrofolate reductase [Candidatus Colwellbacteria bacterium]|nr:dihydrofolate reductase [Candidatus Colwellbacteria bacterium]
MRPKVSIIAAISENGAIGKDNQLLWHIPGDMRRFKELTTGHVVIMGRKTYETIGKPLPNRTNIILTRDKNYSAPDCLVVPSLEEALEKAKEIENDEIFIMGGGEIYRQAIGKAHKLYLTLVHQNFEGDVFFPDHSQFKKEVFREEGESANGLKFTFLELEKLL